MVEFLLVLKLQHGIFQGIHYQTATETAALAAAGTPVGPNTGLGRRYADPEESEVFELGAKILLTSGYLNIAVFDQKIEGFQSNTFIGTGFVLANAGSQSTDGYEFDLVCHQQNQLILQ
jgi:outer membrane receptor protein involved in Fe transport